MWTMHAVHQSVRARGARPRRVQAAGRTKPCLERLETRELLAGVLYVDADAVAGSGDGLSWENAYTELSLALVQVKTVNNDGDPDNDIDSIWIAEGTYTPLWTGRDSSFLLDTDVALYGGFAGTETSLEERDIAAHPTILSGDKGTVGDPSDNVYTVLYVRGGVSAVIDGIRIEGGNADASLTAPAPERACGAGIYNLGSLTLRNFQISSNSASWQGGAIYNKGTLVLEDGVISDNTASFTGGGIHNAGELTALRVTLSNNSATDSGGGLYNDGSATITDSVVVANTAANSWGGGVYNEWGASFSANATTFQDNTAAGRGGGLYNGGEARLSAITFTANRVVEVASSGGAVHNSGDLVIVNAGFYRNKANHGGAIYNAEGGDASVTNAAFSVNIADGGALAYGGAIYSVGEMELRNGTVAGNYSSGYDGGVHVTGNNFTLANSILSLNEALFLGYADSVFSSGSGYNLIGIDPLFVRSPGKGADGVWGTDDDDPGDLSLTPQSPAIDMGYTAYVAGDTLDVDGDGDTSEPVGIDAAGNARVYGTRVDIGAFELQGSPAPGRETWQAVVNTTLDAVDFYDGVVSLREALIYAQPGDTVTFHESLGGQTTVLTKGSLYIDRSIVLDASAISSFTLDGDNKARVLTVLDGEVTLIGIDVTGGMAQLGGGIYNQSTVTLIDVTVTGSLGNTAGGGMYNLGTAVLTGSAISDNATSGYGGGVYNEGELKLIETTVSNNMAVAFDADAYGGGIANANQLTLVGSTVIGNGATTGGGGIENQEGSEAVLIETTVVRNTTGGDGAGVRNVGDLTIVNSALHGNGAAGFGAGVYNGGWLVLVNTSLVGNQSTGAGKKGGAIYSTADKPFAAVNVTITGNSADSGAGIYTDSYLLLWNSLIALNTAADGTELVGTLTIESGANVIGQDPQFTRNPSAGTDGIWGTEDDDYGDLTVLATSPALNAGNNDYVLADSFDLDGDGDVEEPIPFDVTGAPRIRGSSVDAGAVETLVKPVVSSVSFGTDPVVRGQPVVVSAVVSDADGAVTRVEAYRNGTLIGFDDDGADGWNLNLPTVDWTLGGETIEVRAQDTDLAWSDWANASATVVAGDEAVFAGTDGDDVFDLSRQENGEWLAILNGLTYVVDSSFDTIRFQGLDGQDTATIDDTEGDDTVRFWPDLVQGQYSTGVAVELTGTEQVTVRGSSGYDVAVFNDSADTADRFWARPTTAGMKAGAYRVQTKGFDFYRARFSGGTGPGDLAILFGSADSKDKLVVRPGRASIRWSGSEAGLAVATGHRRLVARDAGESADIVDVAILRLLQDSDDRVTGDLGKRRIIVRSSDTVTRVLRFENVLVRGNGSKGDLDIAVVTDSPDRDRLVADGQSNPRLGLLVSPDLTLRLLDLSRITAYSRRGGDDSADVSHVELLDYVLDRRGW